MPPQAQYVKERPGSADFLEQEMPELDSDDDEDKGDSFPYLSKKELREYQGSDFFDPDKMNNNFEKEVRRALAVRKIRDEKSRARVWSQEEIAAFKAHMEQTQAAPFDDTKDLDKTERVPATPTLLESAANTATFRRVEESLVGEKEQAQQAQASELPARPPAPKLQAPPPPQAEEQPSELPDCPPAPKLQEPPLKQME
ncbi:unnamed protein product, partial [Effrenium voratum]